VPAIPACENERLTRHSALLVLAPHPDDEALAFAGLVDAYRSAGKPVTVVVVTDGDAYCDACRFWKSSLVAGPVCDALDLSNFDTPEIDSFAEVRRGESTTSAAIRGLPPPTFLGYPDTGLGAASRNFETGELSKPLQRSDFSKCESCDSDCGYGKGPDTALTADTLLQTLRHHISAMPPGTLIATTHWLDGHGDHAGLGGFVRTIIEDPAATSPRHAAAYAVIHAHTPGKSGQADCWYPAPASRDCPCIDQARALADPGWVGRLASERFLPEWPAGLPDDAAYGEPTHFCLPESFYRGENAIKKRAVASYASQLGRLARNGTHPEALDGIMDCSGYLMSFVRSTEAFVLIEPALASDKEAIRELYRQTALPPDQGAE
jgi:LmbE family N-acetylglucosaminyl deacetylase